MQKTIFLNRLDTGPKATRILLFLVGASQLIHGVSRLDGTLTGWSFVLSSIQILAGLVLVGIGLAAVHPKIFFAPKITLDTGGLVFREGFFARTRHIRWTDIREITFGSFRLEFLKHDNRSEEVRLHTNGQTSVDVKRTIRQLANEKGIPVSGG